MIVRHGYVFSLLLSLPSEKVTKERQLFAHSCARKIAFSSGYTSGLRPRGEFSAKTSLRVKPLGDRIAVDEEIAISIVSRLQVFSVTFSTSGESNQRAPHKVERFCSQKRRQAAFLRPATFSPLWIPLLLSKVGESDYLIEKHLISPKLSLRERSALPTTVGRGEWKVKSAE